MKTLSKTLAIGALALSAAGTSVIAGHPQGAVVIPHPVRCPSCGAPHDVVVTPMKDNAISIKFQKAAYTGNTRGN